MNTKRNQRNDDLKNATEWACKKYGRAAFQSCLRKTSERLDAHRMTMDLFAKNHDAIGALRFLETRGGVIGLTESIVEKTLAEIRARNGWA